MFQHVEDIADLPTKLTELGVTAAIKQRGSILIKVNLPSPPTPDHPKSDPHLIRAVAEYALKLGASCAIAEAANGFLHDNLRCSGLLEFVQDSKIEVLDLDQVVAAQVVVNGEVHYLPTCLQVYGVRMAIPLTSKRTERTLFSNNVKVFVGATPRRFYQEGQSPVPRPRIHENLHQSVANIYRAIMQYAPFHYYINGGMAEFYNRGVIPLGSIYVGDNACELDRFICRLFDIREPEYLDYLVASTDDLSPI